MKGTFTPDHEDNPLDPGTSDGTGTYVDTRGVVWRVTVNTGSLLHGSEWTAQSEGDGDARKYITRTGLTMRTRTDLLNAVDAWVDSKSSSGGGMLLLLIAALLLLDGKRRK